MRHEAIQRTLDEFSDTDPEDKNEFVDTFEEHYDEIMESARITAWPLDPPSSHRMAKQDAETIYDDITGDNND